MKIEIKKNIFLVGCPRSGTTLLQSLLAAHPEIASFPESHFFPNVIPKNNLWKILGIASRKAKPRFQQFLQEIEQNQMQSYLPRLPIFINQYVQTFVKVLDVLTEQQGKSLWLEKTPRHLYYIQHIESYLPEARFIHIIRNGEDVVASMYEVTHKYPELWNGPRNIQQCIDRWIKDREITFSHLHKSSHLLVSYENLVKNTETTLKYICNFLDVNFNEVMINQYSATAKQIKLENEHWKIDVGREIQSNNNQKFYRVFDSSQREYIIKQISKVNLNNKINE